MPRAYLTLEKGFFSFCAKYPPDGCALNCWRNWVRVSALARLPGIPGKRDQFSASALYSKKPVLTTTTNRHLGVVRAGKPYSCWHSG